MAMSIRSNGVCWGLFVITELRVLSAMVQSEGTYLRQEHYSYICPSPYLSVNAIHVSGQHQLIA